MSLLNRNRLFLPAAFSFALLFKGYCFSQDTTKAKKAAIRFANFTEAGIGISDCLSYGIRVSAGIQIKSRLYFGLGTGYEYYRGINDYGGGSYYDHFIDRNDPFDLQVIPIYFDVRYPFYKRGELSIYTCLSAGLSLLTSDPVDDVKTRFGGPLSQGGYYATVPYKYESGYLFYIGLGFSHEISSCVKLLYGFGYHSAGIVLESPYGSTDLVGDYFALRVGIGF